MDPIRTIVTVVRGLTFGTYLTEIEESHADPVFRTIDSAYHLRRYQLPTVYRSEATATRAARILAHRMNGTFVPRSE